MSQPAMIINKVIANFRKLVHSDKVIICCSGGADSMALLFCAQKAFDNILVVHALHDMREIDEALVDAEFVRNYCTKNNLDFEQVSINLRDLDNKPGSEKEYREMRYFEISRCAKMFDFKFAATGHHADDQLETMIMKMCRGAGLRGLAGISPSVCMEHVTYVRPLLDVSKESIFDICKQNNLPYIEDQTNSDESYTRNFIRAKVIPQLKQVFPNCAENSNKLSTNLLDAQKLVDKHLNLLQEYETAPNEIRIEALQISNDIIIYEWLRKACKHTNSMFAVDSLNKDETQKVVEAIRLKEKKTFMLPSKVRVKISLDTVRVI